MHKVTLGVLMIFFHSSGGVWLPPHGHGFLQNDRSLLWGWSRWLQVTDNKPERPPYMVETLQVSRPPVWTWHSWTTCVRFTICRWGCQDWRIMSLRLLRIFEIPRIQNNNHCTAFLFEKLLQSNTSHVRMLLKDYVLCSIFFFTDDYKALSLHPPFSTECKSAEVPGRTSWAEHESRRILALSPGQVKYTRTKRKDKPSGIESKAKVWAMTTADQLAIVNKLLQVFVFWVSTSTLALTH